LRSPAPTFALLAATPLAVVAALALGPDPVSIEAERELIAREAEYVGSGACRTCHPEHHESWSRTYHRTMTQLPTRESVLGRFDGQPLEFFGRRALPFERGGRYFVRLPAAGGGEREAEVALCVGSHRYQQYFELLGDEPGGTYRRLPILWHVGEQRWMHLNGVFLEPDDPDWDRHASTWNENCIFCHNTAPQPRVELLGEPAGARRARSRVGELGIACEACHGPGAEHAARFGSPLARYAARADEHDDLGIVHPREVGQMQALALCGQCHSQRLPNPPERLWQLLDSGPTFRPGELLEDHVAPITRATPSIDARDDGLFRERFWGDGTARLTAYEYLGVLQSPCLAGGTLTCGSCHLMHSGDVAGNMLPEMRGDRACTQCHAEIARDVRGHTHHDPDRSGARCLDCHMPRIVYGVLDVHRSHRIEVPNVARDVEAGRPNACTACHLDRDADWAAEAMARAWGPRYARPQSRPDGATLAIPEAIASLHAGDAVQRAIHAWHFGRAEAAPASGGEAAALAHLVVALGDGYASIRALARRSLLSIEARLGLGLAAELRAFDVFAPPEERSRRVHALLGRVRERSREGLSHPGPDGLLAPDFTLDLERVRALLELQSEHVIEIGE
jgi:predicted CXXCH cytochrome family protein